MNTATLNPRSPEADRAGTVTPLKIFGDAPAKIDPPISSELARLGDESAREEAAEQERRQAELDRQAREAQRPPLGMD